MPFFTTLDGYRTESYSDNSDLYRVNSYSKLLIPHGQNSFSLAATIFTSEWDAPSYLDLALIESGAISDKSIINPTDGGNLDSQMFYAAYRGQGGTSGEWSPFTGITASGTAGATIS